MLKITVIAQIVWIPQIFSNSAEHKAPSAKARVIAKYSLAACLSDKLWEKKNPFQASIPFLIFPVEKELL